MKNKIISITIIFVLIITLFMPLCRVEAYSGEIDPENYINLPSAIWVENKVGTGTISLSSSANGYTISYQKIDVTKTELDNMKNKSEELSEYIETSNQEIKKKQDDLTTLQENYQKLQQDATSTEEQLTEARTNYETAYAEYSEYYQNIKTQVEKLQAEYLALIPNYTNSWKTTTNTTNNIELDFKDYTGTAHFILWVKIDNGTNTYYDFMGYSTEIKEEKPNEEEKPTDENEKQEEQQAGNWTNFKNAKFELVKDGISGAIVNVSNVTPNEKNTYYLYITNNANKPDISSLADSDKMYFKYSNEDNKFIADSYKIAEKIELNQDLYAVVVEYNNAEGKDNIVSYGTKLTRFDEAKYNDAFHATFMTYDTDQLITTFTHAEANNRKMEIKVGKITDKSILNKIKNKDSSAFSELMKYAKSNKGIYDQILDADKDDSYAIRYDAGEGTTKNNSVIQLNGLQNEEYYYLYVKTDDENGKYISNEAVTLAQASTHDDGKWFMFFYGSSDFKWAEFGSEEIDDTKAPNVLPFAGVNNICIVLLGLISVGGFVAYKQYKKYNF